MSDTLSTLGSLLYGGQSKTSIGSLSIDVLISEKSTLPSLATEYPVEEGSPITDGIVRQSKRLSLSGSLANASTNILNAVVGALGGVQQQTGIVKLQNAIAVLETIYTTQEPITITTGLTVYSNYAMVECEVSRSNGEAAGWLDIRAEFVKIRKVSSQTAYVNAGSSVSGKAGKTKTASVASTTTPSTATSTQATTTVTSILGSLLQ